MALPAADAAPFDPTAGSYAAGASPPAGVEAVDAARLTPYQRSLLVIDGTVTTFLEAHWLEPVEVRRIAQAEARLAAPEPWLELAAGEPVIRRRVVLLGSGSGRCFAWADTLAAAGRLDAGLRDGLEQAEGGLGRILIDNRAETRREGLWFGRERVAEPPPGAGGAGSPFLSRCYRVFSGGRPLLLITERFPL